VLAEPESAVVQTLNPRQFKRVGADRAVRSITGLTSSVEAESVLLLCSCSSMS